jgi:hypothetical protein
MIESSYIPRKREGPMRCHSKQIALVILLLALPSHAEKRPFALVGIGVETCELVVTHLRGNNMRMKNFTLSWFQGYLSGRNAEKFALTGRILMEEIIPDQDAIRAFVESYCESNPQRQAYEAGDALWDSLRPKR